MAKKNTKSENQQQNFPPVVTVLGHVDHGKTSLLDAIRKTSIAAAESGGITQKIGASSVQLLHEGVQRSITFIDTPGHEAFDKMRSRGALAADVGLLIVSSTDGVMPQTKESIQILQKAQLPFIVVLTKADLADKNPEKVKQQLIKEKVLLEGYGGDVPLIEVSAKTGINIKELLDLILLFFDMRKKSDVSSENPLSAIVIESGLDQKAGPKATIVVKNGTVNVRDDIVCLDQTARVRNMIDPTGKRVMTASVGEAVEVLGFTKVPAVGSIVMHVGSENHTKEALRTESLEKPEFTAEEGLSLLLIADTEGSLEAIKNRLPEKVRLLLDRTGEVSTADVLFAKSAGAIILSFNTKIRTDVKDLAFQEKVLLKNYTLIYEMLEEIKDVLEGKRVALLEQIFGTAKILAEFPFEKQKVLGIQVLDGRIARGDKVRLMAGETVKGESTVTSVRQGKNTVSKVEKGIEAGIILSPGLDFTIGDMLLSHS